MKNMKYTKRSATLKQIAKNKKEGNNMRTYLENLLGRKVNLASELEVEPGTLGTLKASDPEAYSVMARVIGLSHFMFD